MIPAAELRARVVVMGVSKGNRELMKFDGTLKQVAGQDATATLGTKVDDGGFTEFATKMVEAKNSEATAALKANVDGAGFTEFKVAMTDARISAAKPIVAEARLKYDKGVFSDLRREIFITKKAMGGFGGSGRNLGSALSGAVAPFGKIGTAALAAGPQVLALAGGLTSVAGSAVGAAEGLGAVGLAAGGVAAVGIGGIAAVAIPAVMSLKALTEAQKSYIAAVETYGVQSSQAETAAKKLTAVERSSGKEAVGLVGSLDQVKERWSSLTKPGREAFLGGLSDAIDRVDQKLPMLGKSANRSAEIGRKGFDSFLTQVTGSDFNKFVGTMTNTEEHIVPQLSKATGDWGQILERVATDAAPSLERVVGIFTHWSKEVLGSTDNSHKLQGEISHLTTDFMDWVHLLTASGSLLHDIFDAGEGSGNELVVDTTKQFKEWGAWIDSHGPQVEAFFTQTKEGVEVLASILGHVGKDWFVMSKAMEPIETGLLHILDDFAQIHIGGASALTYLLGGFALLKVAIAAVKIKDLVEFMGFLKAATNGSKVAAEQEAAALSTQTAATEALTAANGELAASIEAVNAAQMTMLDTAPLADAEKAGQLSMFPMGSGLPTKATTVGEDAVRGAETVGGGAAGAGIAATVGAIAIPVTIAAVGIDKIATHTGHEMGDKITNAVSEVIGKETAPRIEQALAQKNVGKLEAVRKHVHQALQWAIEQGTDDANLKPLREQLNSLNRDVGQIHAPRVDAKSMLGDLLSGQITQLGDIRKTSQQAQKDISAGFKKGGPEWKAAMERNMLGVVSAIKAGEDAGIISTKQGNQKIAAEMRRFHIFTGDDPFHIASGFTSGWAKAGSVNSQQIRNALTELQGMPPRARAIARVTMLEQVREFERGGKLTKGSFSKLRSAVITELEATKSGSLTQMVALVRGMATGSSSMDKAVSSGMGILGKNVNSALHGLGVSKPVSFTLIDAGKALANIALGRQEGGFTVPGAGSGDRYPAVVPHGSFVMNREATAAHGLQRGGVPVMLEAKERVFMPHEVAAAGPGTLAAMNASAPRFAKGGRVGGGISEPHIAGPGALQSVGQAAIHQVYKGAESYLAKHKPKGGDAGYMSGGGGSVIAQIGRILMANGLNKIGAAGIIGNAKQESGWNPASVGSGGGGLWGFTSGEISLSALQDFAKQSGKAWTDVGLQTQFLLDHVPSGVVSGLNASKSAGAAAAYFMNEWERPAVATENQANREAGARQAFAMGYQHGGPVRGHHHHHAPPPVGSPSWIETLSAPAPHREKWTGWTPDGRYDPAAARHLITGGEALEIPTTIKPTESAAQKKAKSASAADAVHWEMSHLGDSDQWGYPGEWCGAFQAAGMEAIGLTPPSGFASAATWAGYGTNLGKGHIQAGAELVYGSAHVAMAINSSEQIQGNDQNGQVGTSGIGGIIGGSALTAVRWPPYGTGPGAGSAAKEKVPAVFHGARTAKLSLSGAVPKTIHGIQREVARREGELRTYRHAVAAAKGMPATLRKLEANVTVLETRLSQLRKAASKLRRQIAEKHFSHHLGHSLGNVTGFEKLIEAKQRDYQEKSEFAEHVVGLEPTEPILAANATEGQRETAEKAYVGELAAHITGKEGPAYAAVLGSEAVWRNTILGGEHAATSFEGLQESRIRILDGQIQGINALTEKAAADAAAWRGDKNNKGKPLPARLKGELGTAADQRALLPVLRFQEAERRKVLGEARGEFYGGRKHPVQPPATPLAGTGTFEQALIEVQGTHWPGLHSPLTTLPETRSASGFGGAIWATEEAIEGLGLRLAQGQASLAGLGAGSGSEGNSQREEALAELLTQANQRNLVAGLLGPTLAQFEATYPMVMEMPPYAGKAHTGAIVPGPRTQEKTMVVKGREGIFTEEQMAAMGTGSGSGDVHVVINGHINQEPGDTRDPIEVLRKDPRFGRMVREEIRTTKRGVVTSGAGRANRP